MTSQQYSSTTSILLMSAALLFSSPAIAKPHTAKILGNVTLTVNNTPFHFVRANSTMELIEGSVICIEAGDGEVSIDNGAIQLSTPPECKQIPASKGQGFFASIRNIIQRINPAKSKGELSRPANRGSGGSNKAKTIIIEKNYTAPILYNNAPYLAINVSQLLSKTSTYPLTLVNIQPTHYHPS